MELKVPSAVLSLCPSTSLASLDTGEVGGGGEEEGGV